MQLILLRHAESEDNQSQVLGGNSEAPLTLAGREEAQKSGRTIAQSHKVTRLITSPRKRCVETAEIVLSELGGADLELEIDERLTEREFGTFSGQAISEVDFRFLDTVAGGTNEHGVESLADLRQRVELFLKSLQESSAKEEVVVVVTHSNPLRFFVSILEDKTFEEVLNAGSFKNAEFRVYNLSDSAVRHGVTAIISRLNAAGEKEYLLIRSTRNKGEHTGKHYPPSGWIKKGESEQQAVERELMEELSLRIQPIRKIADLPGDLPELQLHFWECKILEGEIKMNMEELKDFGWFTIEQMKNLSMYPATVKLFKEYIQAPSKVAYYCEIN